MRVYQSLCLIKTNGANAFYELTSILRNELEKSGVLNGILLLSVLHTTAAVAMQEPDTSVHHDSGLVLDNAIPAHLDYEHIYEGIVNATAHQKQLLVGNSKLIPVKNGSLVLGTWQRPFLIEFFRSMERKVSITVIGE